MKSRNKRVGALFVAVLWCTLPTTATASDPRNIDLRSSPSSLLGVETTLMVPHLSPFVTLGAMHANDELVILGRDGKQVGGPLHSRWTGVLAAGLGIADLLEVAVGAKLVAAAAGGAPTFDIGIGDLTLSAKARIFGAGNDEAGFAIGLAADLTFPIGDALAFHGEGGWAVTPWLLLDYRDPDTLYLSLNLGYRVRPTKTVLDLAIGHEIRYSVGLEVPLHAYGLSALLELHGSVGLGETPRDLTGIDERKAPLEALGALRWRHKVGVDVIAGFGGGMTAGYGAPDWRAVLRVGWALGHAPPHAFDGQTSAVSNAEGNEQPKKGPHGPAVPDVKTPSPVSPDGKPSGVAKTFAPPATLPLDSAAFDAAAAADPDPDGDGLPNDIDKCPNAAEDLDKFEDSDGCPDPDNDQDGVADAADKCPLKAETVNGVDDDDGCPDEGTADVVKVDGKLELKKKVFFASSSDRIKRKSFPLLKQVAALIRASPEVTLIDIEGHTDSNGNKDANVDLSIRRAYAVKRFLTNHGVKTERLRARGYGATKAIASNKSGKGRATNRRVEFVIKATKAARP